MVLGRNDKRKRKEGDLVDLMDPLPESPKRTKVHAQRKFAQGAATVFSPPPPLAKEREKPKPATITELITHKRPNTEDFLTFLCFRGTSILPPSLNFFNIESRKEKAESKASGTAKTIVKTGSTSSSTSANVAKVETANSASTKSPAKNSTPVKKKVVPTVQKSLNKYKTTNTTVQALKKKYQEQRLAKQRIKNKFKASCVMRTRSATERVVLKSLTKIPPRKFVSRAPDTTKRRHGLRSGGLLERAKKANLSTFCRVRKVVPQKQKKQTASKKKSSESSESSESSTADEENDDDDDDSDDDDEVDREEKNTPQTRKITGKTATKKICTRSKSEMKRITRSQRENSAKTSTTPNSLVRRPSRKTKEAAAVYMEILGRKLVSPDLENEDNVSVDSFPELPNARRTAQAENEIRAKSRAARNRKDVKDADSRDREAREREKKEKDSKEKDCREKESKEKDSKDTKSDGKSKTKPVKSSILKSKRTLRVRKYCELDSEDESETSVEPEKPRQLITRRGSKKMEKETSRNLRSSLRNHQPMKPEPAKIPAKSTSTPKENKQKRGRGEKKVETEEESEEEPLGNLLTKMRNKRKNPVTKSEEKPETRKSSSCEKSATPNEETKREIVSTKPKEKSKEPEMSQVSDDEESFRGFTKKAISKVLNSCNSHASANLLTGNETATISAKNLLDIVEEKAPIELKNFKDEKTIVKIENTEKIEHERSAIVPKIEESTKIVEAQSQISETKCKQHSAMENEDSSINILDMSLPGSRKSRVNMSTERIEKWLNESSIARETQNNKAEPETTNTRSGSNFPFETSEKMTKDTNHLSIPTRIQHLVRPVNVTIPKLVDKSSRAAIHGKLITSLMPLTRFPLAKPADFNIPAPNRNKINADIKEIIKGRGIKSTGMGTTSATIREILMGDESDGVSKSDQNSVDDSSPEKKSTPEKKAIFQQRKTFLPRVKERKNATPSATAFSPENESSVYAFESDTEVPINTPFRRKLRELGKHGNSRIDEDEDTAKFRENSDIGVKNASGTFKESSAARIEDKFTIPKNFGNLSTCQVLPLGKITNEWSAVNCSASIAVQVNFDEQNCSNLGQIEGVDGSNDDKRSNENSENSIFAQNSQFLVQQKSTEISTQTENTNDTDNDNDNGHVFYIPLQSVGRNGPNGLVQGQQLIQGVAVKLGTEGPNGPNQRVLLRAQLVTKPPIAVARCPPVGTVQPTTRNPPNSGISLLDHPYGNDTNAPSTSASSISLDPPIVQSPAPRPPANIPRVISGTEKTTKSPKATRERKASVDSSKAGKRLSGKGKLKASDILASSNVSSYSFAGGMSPEARLVEAPTFHPTEKDFQDPLEYIDKIRSVAEKFGICRVVPPANFKPECKVSDDMRFTAYNQYVHRMLHRWGPNVKEMMAIKKYLATQSITLTHPPWIGGMEVDLPHLYQTVQSLGGLKEVIEKKKWQKVADGMKIPKSAQDRVTKLDDIYCKYLLPYDTLSPGERGKLFDDVEADWKKRETKTLQRLDAQLTDNEDDEDDDSSEEIEECIIKGRNMPLNAFYRIARNTQRMWFGENQRPSSEAEGASAIEVEAGFWKHVAERKRHVCVHAASIDSSGRGFGFSVAKNSPFARHPWNLKVLTNNAGSVLRALGPLMGVTVPTLHVGMLFSACCWYRDPHGLPWIEYLHTGAKKIWYGIPDEHNNNFREALSKMVPRYCKKKTIWLPSDTAMVPPELLVNNGVPLCRTVQEPGQFIVVFPKAFTSSICTGYVVSESVYFAQPAWLENAEQVFKDLQDSCEPSIFSFERLLFSIINDSRSQYDVLKQIMPVVMKIRDREIEYRQQLEYIGLTDKEKLPLPGTGKGKKGKRVNEEDGDFECETCRTNLFVSLVNNSQDDSMYCLPHALQLFVRKKQLVKHCTLMYTYTKDELDDLIHKLEDRIEAKSKKTNQIRQSK